ncbi:actin-like ATPase domain-containing protein [Clavulina sp. PMI_390]|nr:actin-like ATPase domain-containing protein [Clavulina sp. PMI_390]
MQLRRTQNEYPLLLSLPPLMSRTTHERIAQICFEHLNVAGLSIFERPLMQLFSANAVSGVVIDISHNYTDIAAIVDSEVQKASVTSVPIGLGTCEMYLAHTFKRNAAILKELNSPEPLSAEDLDLALLEVVRIAWAEGRIQVPHVEGSAPPPPAEEESAGIEDIAAIMVSGKEKAIIEAAAKKKTTAQEKKAAASAAEKERQALDLIDIEFDFTPKGGEERSYKVTLGKERHQLWEPLFDPTLLSRLGPALPEELKTQLEDKPLGVQEAVRGSVQSLEGKDRAAAWDGIFLTGDSSMKNLEPAFLSRLNPYLTRDPENGTQSQPIATRMLKLPEYFAEYRDKGSEIASFLGACIVAKLTFTDTIGGGKAFITKTEYGEKGPTAIRDILP